MTDEMSHIIFSRKYCETNMKNEKHEKTSWQFIKCWIYNSKMYIILSLLTLFGEFSFFIFIGIFFYILSFKNFMISSWYFKILLHLKLPRNNSWFKKSNSIRLSTVPKCLRLKLLHSNSMRKEKARKCLPRLIRKMTWQNNNIASKICQ